MAGEEATQTAILGELKIQSGALAQLGRSQAASLEVLADLTRSMTIVLERQKTPPTNNASDIRGLRQAVTWGNLGTLLGALFAIFTLVVYQQSSAIDILASSQVDFAKDMRTTWSDHDARVISMNTEQSLVSGFNCGISRQIWSQVFPSIEPPACILPARPGEDFH